MEEYIEQCKLVKCQVEKAIEKGVSIVICGPEFSGKSYIQEQMEKILDKNNYNICYGIYDFKEINRYHGRTYTDKKYWIEEKNKNLLSDLLIPYEYIETPLKYPELCK